MEEINNVCNVQSEIMFVGALYKSPDLYVTYGNFMRPKYDFSDEVVYFLVNLCVWQIRMTSRIILIQ